VIDDLGSEANIHDQATQCEADVKTNLITYDRCHWYTSKNLHRATTATQAGRRLLIRAKFSSPPDCRLAGRPIRRIEIGYVMYRIL